MKISCLKDTCQMDTLQSRISSLKLNQEIKEDRKILVIALAAPVEVGIIDKAQALALLKSLCVLSTIF